ncbi:SRPBCC domain-containing protein [Leifsonia sp. NPDC058292]|uniref:SRPBCC domain-containing protein n=1 Tax=Leifsonia sp. NPDC058292 TaxID=3346428 RepID=UPI0036DB7EC7
MTETAEATTTVAAAPDAVWHAITDPESIAKYLYGTRVETDWRQGSPIVYRGEWEGKPYEDKGVILEITPPTRLVTSYYSPLSGKPDEPASYQNVTYAIAADGEGSRVTITQDGCADSAEAERMSANWAATLDGLKGVVEAG